MSDRECEEEHDALLPPGFSTPTKANSNDGAGHGRHAEPDAEGTEVESDAESLPMLRNNSMSRRAC